MIKYCVRGRRSSYIFTFEHPTSIYFLYVIDGVQQLGGAFRRNKVDLDRNYFSISRWEI